MVIKYKIEILGPTKNHLNLNIHNCGTQTLLFDVCVVRHVALLARALPLLRRLKRSPAPFLQSQRTASVGWISWISGCQCSNNIDGISLSVWRDKFKCESWVVKDNLEMLWVAEFKTDAVVQIFQMSEIRLLPNPMT